MRRVDDVEDGLRRRNGHRVVAVAVARCAAAGVGDGPLGQRGVDAVWLVIERVVRNCPVLPGDCNELPQWIHHSRTAASFGAILGGCASDVGNQSSASGRFNGLCDAVGKDGIVRDKSASLGSGTHLRHSCD